MELKEEDFLLITALDGVKALALRPDYFDDKPVVEQVKEAMEQKLTVEIVEVPEPTEEELAEIKKQKLIEEKQAELAKLLGD